MREVAFFWKYDRLDAIGISSVSDIAKRIEFLSYIKRVPKDIRCLFKIHLHENMTLDDLERIESLEVLEVVQTSENPEEGNLVICRVIHRFQFSMLGRMVPTQLQDQNLMRKVSLTSSKVLPSSCASCPECYDLWLNLIEQAPARSS